MFKSTAPLLIAITFILFFGCGSDSTDDSPSNSCSTPTNLTVNGYLGTTADLSWNSDNAANIYFDIQYGPSNFSLGDGVTVTSSNTSTSIEGLETSVSYDAYLRKNCGAERSEWVGPVSFTTLCDDDGIYVGDLQFRSQGELNSFDWECYIGLDGHLQIGPDYPNVTDPITNFNALSQLTYIKELRIYDNAALENLNGLENLQEIDFLVISKNPNLVTFQGLNNLTKVTGYGISISSNYSLDTLEGLDSLNEVSLLSIVETNPPIDNGNGLVSLTGLNNLTTLQKLTIQDCNNLTSLDGFAPNLTSIEDSIFIEDCINLTNIEGLSNIEELQTVYIRGCSSLTSLNGLHNINILTGTLNISDNDLLLNLIGAPNITEGNNYFIEFNENLMSLEGLNIPTSINGELHVVANPNLTTIEHLSGLQSVGFRIQMYWNDSLTSLQGLEDLIFIDGPISIYSNNNLNDFCALTNIAVNGTISGDTSIYGNSYNPSLEDIQAGNCSN